MAERRPTKNSRGTCIFRGRVIALALFMVAAQPAWAGPPFQSDDPQPTDYQHFEIYAFIKGVTAEAGQSGQSGIDFNYGAAPDLQLTAVLPYGFNNPTSDVATSGVSNIELAAKYRFLHQDTFGLDVSVFPRVFLPSPSSVGDAQSSLLLPLWVQKDWGDISAFGGGGCQFTISGGARHSCIVGGTITKQFLPRLQLGAEIFHQTSDGITLSSTTLGAGGRYDIDEHYHLLGYLAHGLQNVSETGSYSWYAAVLFTF
jgi:hypothetical protein